MKYYYRLSFELDSSPIDLRGPAPKPLNKDLPPSYRAKKRQFSKAMWELVNETDSCQYYRHLLFSDCFKVVFKRKGF